MTDIVEAPMLGGHFQLLVVQTEQLLCVVAFVLTWVSIPSLPHLIACR